MSPLVSVQNEKATQNLGVACSWNFQTADLSKQKVFVKTWGGRETKEKQTGKG